MNALIKAFAWSALKRAAFHIWEALRGRRRYHQTWPGEEAGEALWKKRGGVDPETGESYLTPRMERIQREVEKITKS